MIHTINLDQPENPRIRTKINALDGNIDKPCFDLICNLKDKKISIEIFQAAVLDYFLELAREGKFDEAAAKTGPEHQSEWLLKRHLDEGRYSILCYFVSEGEVHPPHHHHNVASTQIVLKGKLHLREYNRVRRDENGSLILSLASDRILGPGNSFQASEWRRNVHWFSAVEGPAVIFNMNVRGFEPTTFESDESRYGRLYVDPTRFGSDGLITAAEFDEAEANRRFQSKSLSELPIPSQVMDLFTGA